MLKLIDVDQLLLRANQGSWKSAPINIRIPEGPDVYKLIKRAFKIEIPGPSEIVYLDTRLPFGASVVLKVEGPIYADGERIE